MVKGVHLKFTPKIKDKEGVEVSELSIPSTEVKAINNYLEQKFGKISKITIYSNIPVVKLEIASKQLDTDSFKWNWITD